jgi:hypothetical protein
VPKRKIQDQAVPTNLKISFSFEFYDTQDDTYCMSKFSTEQVRKAMNRLKDISTKTFHELQQQRKVLHFGSVVWEKTIKPTGFENAAINGLDSFHFALLGVNEQLARVYGAYSQGVFYVVWFDLEHKIWPTKLRNT